MKIYTFKDQYILVKEINIKADNVKDIIIDDTMITIVYDEVFEYGDETTEFFQDQGFLTFNAARDAGVKHLRKRIDDIRNMVDELTKKIEE